MSGEQVINSEGQEIINQDGTARVTSTDGCGSCGCDGEGCWYLAQACCPQIDQRTLAYPCTEPNPFEETDPPNPVTFVYLGECFTLFPTQHTTHQTGWIDITAADIQQVISDCTDPVCGPPCGKYYQALAACCANPGAGQDPEIIYGDCDPQYWFGQPGVVAFKIGGKCYTPLAGAPCSGLPSPPPGYIGPGPYGFVTYPTCEACCVVNPPPPPVGCPDNCTSCSNTYTVTVPPVTCFIPDPEGCVEPNPPLCLCPVGDCTYINSQMNVPVHKQQPIPQGCFWQGMNVTPNGQVQSGCCVPDPGTGGPGTKINDLEYVVSVVCGVDGFGDPQWTLSLGGGLLNAIYQRNTPPTTEGCPVGTYVKVADFSPCAAPNTVTLG